MQTVFSYTLLDCVSLILCVPMGVRCVALRIPYPIHYTCVVHIFSSFHSVSCSFCLTKTIIVQTKIIQSSHTNAFVCDDLYIAVSVQATRHMHTYSLVPMSNNIVFCWCRWFIQLKMCIKSTKHQCSENLSNRFLSFSMLLLLESL